ncbi:alpha-amylase-like [Eriocheir sinensis]|uniref:alpha-amylase-like n=1 Tax=Eriocheir sinensis TaxID=95602 RepID=UPI0021CA8FBE|nr:alpha-amylase-like [Eriocheir sinensis]
MGGSSLLSVLVLLAVAWLGVARAASLNRTVVFLFKETESGQDLFIRGGIDSAQRPGCTDDAETDPCAIDMITHSLGTISHYESYNSWRVGDTRLDWMGAQAGQGNYNGLLASGTPLAWTTNNVLSPAFQELNTFGDHYWMVDMGLDCSQAEEGWFEIKAIVTSAGDVWEGDITQTACSGTGGGTAPYTSANHLGRCGYVNIFTFDSSLCVIDTFP